MASQLNIKCKNATMSINHWSVVDAKKRNSTPLPLSRPFSKASPSKQKNNESPLMRRRRSTKCSSKCAPCP